MKKEPTLRVGLIGCGGRGTGAAEDHLKSSQNVELIALADMFQDRLDGCRSYLSEQKLPGFAVKDEHCFIGFDAYKKLLELPVDLVLLCTPPGFRPTHVEAAIEAGKHVFMEKPVAVDPVGVRRIRAAGERARSKNLAVVAGTQYRHHAGFIATMEEMHGGRIGEIREARCYYNTGPIWRYDRKPGESDMEWQIRNWYYFDWLSGDHIVEQHIHTLDTINWGLGGNPLKATATGGRQLRTGSEHGNIYDHFAVDYEYAGGVHVMSLCRQWAGADSKGGAFFTGSEGVASPYSGEITGAKPWKYQGNTTLGHAYVKEHADLVASIRAGKPLNETQQVADSTLTAILGRQAAYTGKTVTWQQMLESTLDLSPSKYEFGPLQVRPVPIPGQA